MTPATPWRGPIVDAHQHFWDPTRNHHPWLADDAMIPFRYGDYGAIKRPYLPPDYQAGLAGHDVRQSVYVETEWDPADPIGETRYASALAARFGLPNAIVAQAWLDRENAAAVLAAQAAFPLVRSVRHKPGGPANPAEVGTTRTLMSSDRWRQGFALLARHGLHFDLQTSWCNWIELLDLARDFPATMIILNHAGLPPRGDPSALAAWHGAMGRLAELPNLMVKLSGLGRPGHAWATREVSWIVRETVTMFGAERCMVGSNFPVDSLCASFDQVIGGLKAITADMAADRQQALFLGTATRIYRPCLPAAIAPRASSSAAVG